MIADRPQLWHWLRNANETHSAFARRLRRPVHPSMVLRWCLPKRDPGRVVPRPAAMADIWIATRGAIDPNSFYDLPELKIELPAPAAHTGVSSLEQLAAAGARAPAGGFVGDVA